VPIFRSSSSSSRKGFMSAKEARKLAERAQRKADFKAARKGDQAAADRVRGRGK